MFYLYKITNEINNKSYIGITRNYEKRFSNHKTRYLNKQSKEYNKLLYKTFRKYGIENFTFKIIDKTDNKTVAFSKEIDYIKLYNSKSKGYNETIGGENPQISSNLTNKDIEDIRTRFNKLESIINIYEDYKDKLSYQSFANLCYGKSWNDVYPELINLDIIEKQKINNLIRVNREISDRNKHNNHKPSKKLNEDDVLNIRKLYSEGISIPKILEIYKEKVSSYNTIANIIKK